MKFKLNNLDNNLVITTQSIINRFSTITIYWIKIIVINQRYIKSITQNQTLKALLTVFTSFMSKSPLQLDIQDFRKPWMNHLFNDQFYYLPMELQFTKKGEKRERCSSGWRLAVRWCCWWWLLGCFVRGEMGEEERRKWK